VGGEGSRGGHQPKGGGSRGSQRQSPAGHMSASQRPPVPRDTTTSALQARLHEANRNRAFCSGCQGAQEYTCPSCFVNSMASTSSTVAMPTKNKNSTLLKPSPVQPHHTHQHQVPQMGALNFPGEVGLQCRPLGRFPNRVRGGGHRVCAKGSFHARVVVW
jgi:hypothetical protein